MTKVKVAGFSVSLDGFAAGTAQSLEHPLGVRGAELFQWYFPTRTFHQMLGKEDGEAGPDDRFAQRAMEGFGAFILGRNMFGPVRGEWPDEQWKGWWGDTPPYHAPTFILTHYARQAKCLAYVDTSFDQIRWQHAHAIGAWLALKESGKADRKTAHEHLVLAARAVPKRLSRRPALVPASGASEIFPTRTNCRQYAIQGVSPESTLQAL